MPSIAFAEGSGHGGVRAVKDKEMQGDGGVGPVDILILSGVITGDRVNHAVPLVGFAGSGRKLIGGGVMDGQIERVDLRTSVGILMGIVVGTGNRVGETVAVGPGVGVDSHFRGRSVYRMVDGQMQRDEAVATVAARE